MHARHVLLTASLLVAAAAACDDVTYEPPTPFDGQLSAVGGSGIRGSIGALSQDEQTQAEIGITGGAAQTTYTWQIRTGSCANPGGALGGPGSYQVLETNMAGADTARGLLGQRLSETVEYNAVVLTSATPAAPVACGRLGRFSQP